MSGAASRTQNFLADAFSIVPNPHPKPPLVVVNFDFDPLGVSVVERIAQRLDCNPVDLIAH
jgi:hypothetical protein